MTPKGNTIRTATLWTVSVMLGVVFLFAGVTKLAGSAMHVQHFAEWGYPQGFRLFVGAWETLFGLMLLVPRAAFYAAVALSAGMGGAIYTQLFRGDPPAAVFPLVMLILLAWVAVRRRSTATTDPVPAG